jgi:hypothetical protein
VRAGGACRIKEGQEQCLSEPVGRVKEGCMQCWNIVYKREACALARTRSMSITYMCAVVSDHILIYKYIMYDIILLANA